MSWRWLRGGCLICITISRGGFFAEGEDLVLVLPSPFDAAVDWPVQAGEKRYGWRGTDLDFGFGFSSPVWGRRERSADGSGLALDFPSPFDADMNWPV